jgi:hypothetical protein
MTIVVSDKVVGIDGEFYSVENFNNVPSEISVLQWQNDVGEIEFFDMRPNEKINSLPDWSNNLHEQWIVEKNNNTYPEPSISDMNKIKAIAYLANTDWAVLSDVDTLQNRMDFIECRKVLREIVINPPNNQIVFPTIPKAIWG